MHDGKRRQRREGEQSDRPDTCENRLRLEHCEIDDSVFREKGVRHQNAQTVEADASDGEDFRGDIDRRGELFEGFGRSGCRERGSHKTEEYIARIVEHAGISEKARDCDAFVFFPLL